MVHNNDMPKRMRMLFYMPNLFCLLLICTGSSSQQNQRIIAGKEYSKGVQPARTTHASVLGCGNVQLAAFHGHAHCLDILLKNGAKIDEKSADGLTALHVARRIEARTYIPSLYQDR